MSVVDLTRRITMDFKEYSEYKTSHDSLIYVGNDPLIQSNTSLTITVGRIWYDGKKHTDIRIPDKGLKVKPKDYVVLKTKQKICIPYNVYGIVVGKGVDIFNGGVISTGKIVPGYRGELRIGYYNAGTSTIVLHEGDALACCIFFDVESTITELAIDDESEGIPVIEDIKLREKICNFVNKNWYSLISTILAVIAIVVSIMK